MSKNNKAIDLFCGCGGISKGIERSGFDVVWAIDHEKYAKETFDENHDADMAVADIRKISPEDDVDLEKEDVDLVVGGPPCPTFSVVGRSVMRNLEGEDPEEDERHLLYEDFLRFVDYFEPKAFVMENVKGMLSAQNADGEPVVEVIKNEMEDLGYEVNVQLLDAANYGVPQHRERLFFIANRIGEDNPDMQEWETHREPKNEEEKKMKFLEDEEQNFPVFEKGIEKKPWNTLADAIMDLPPVSPKGDTPPKSMEEYPLGPISKYQRWARQETDKLDSHVCRGHNMRDLTLYKLLGEGTSYVIGDIPDEHQPYRSDIFQDNYRKQNPNRPSSTVVAHLYKDGHNFIHPTEARSITAREAARLQSFPDSFKFPVSRTQSFKQIGNAVPMLLAQAVGTAVKEDLFGDL